MGLSVSKKTTSGEELDRVTPNSRGGIPTRSAQQPSSRSSAKTVPKGDKEVLALFVDRHSLVLVYFRISIHILIRPRRPLFDTASVHLSINFMILLCEHAHRICIILFSTCAAVFPW